MKNVIRRVPIPFLVALLAAPLAARAAEEPAQAAPQPSVVAAEGGLIALYEAEDGSLSGQAEALDQLVGEMALEEGFSTSSAGLTLVELPDGSLMVNLEGRFQSALVATLAADGSVSVEHRRPLDSAAPADPSSAPACRLQGGAR